MSKRSRRKNNKIKKKVINNYSIPKFNIVMGANMVDKFDDLIKSTYISYGNGLISQINGTIVNYPNNLSGFLTSNYLPSYMNYSAKLDELVTEIDIINLDIQFYLFEERDYNKLRMLYFKRIPLGIEYKLINERYNNK